MTEKNQKSLIKAKIKESLSMSTLKGIPRVMKTKNKCIKSLWAVGTIMVILAAGCHWYYLFSGYLKRTVFTIVQENYEAILSNENFPGLTLCSLVPFSKDPTGEIPSYEQFHTKLLSKIKELEKRNKTLNSRTKRLLIHKSIYYDWLGLNDARKIGQKEGVFILNCKLKISGYEGAYLPCRNYSTITLIQNPYMFNCYAIKFNLPQIENGVIDKAVFTLYLDEISPDYSFYLKKNYNLLGEGIKILVHDKNNKFPRVQNEGFIISKGTKSIVTTRPVFRVRKPEPYTNCQEIPNDIYNFTGNLVKANSFAYCSLRLWQNEVVKKHGCISTTLLIVSELDHLKLPRCKELGRNITLNGLEAVINFINNFYNITTIEYDSKNATTGGRCRHPCYEHYFKQSYSSIDLKGSYFINLLEYADNVEAIKNYLKVQQTFQKCIEKDTEKSCIEKLAIVPYKNLIELEVQQNIHFGALVEFDAPVFELPDFLAKLAATINFWVGFSAIIFIEIIDLILQICIPGTV
ncbi:DgyrCDS2623 [Dimorphilus gyrociliatus]|uniref:DgyrCDS2623 n=1 Tax=Dimorphilus gyrociliatus TaxID=2664684 RepID=A0A7I8VB15_9ANNE|nr:DgyrCDS2623 [Dimorphilus gyrociliatus]